MALWFLLTLPLPWLLALLPEVRDALQALLGAVAHGRPQLILATGFGLACLATGASAVVARRWQRPRVRRPLTGWAWIAVPALGAALVVLRHTVLMARIDSVSMDFRSFAEISVARAAMIQATLFEAVSDHINAAGLLLALVGYVATLVLLAHVFTTPLGERPALGPRRWWVLATGVLLMVVAEAGVLPLLGGSGGIWGGMAWLCWLLMAIPMLRARAGRDARVEAPLEVLGAGITTFVALTGLGVAMGYSAGFAGLDTYPPDQRALAWSDVSRVVVQSVASWWACFAVLTALLVAASWPALSGLLGLRAELRRALGATAALVAVTAAPWLLVMAGMDAAAQALAVPTWRPAVVEMAPGALGERGPPSFYIDRMPANLRVGRGGFLAALTGARARRFEPDALLAALARGGPCRAALEASMGAADAAPSPTRPPPARCLTAVEAKVYCESRGKRLPSAREWAATVGRLPVAALEGDGRSGPIQRSALREWTMDLEHGTPTFALAPATAAGGPAPAPDTIGFRCAWAPQQPGDPASTSGP